MSLDTDVDPAPARDQFELLPGVAYLVGNSLGLMPKSARAIVNEDLDAWATLGVRGHHHGQREWITYPELLNAPMARIVGAETDEVVAMNGLTVNLHLLLTSFYRPSGQRTLLVMEDYAFSSDSYAFRSHVASRGLDPDTEILRLRPRAGEDCLRTEDIIAAIREHGDRIATVLLGGVNYLTGECMDIPAITRVTHDVGAVAGWDLAHAAGNVELRVHDWDVDFAAWCSYKYLNSGPGSVSGVFIHERHHGRTDLARLEGWWGNREETRFRMDPTIDPALTAAAWSLSCTPVLIMAPTLASLMIFDQFGMGALRARSLRLTEYLFELLDVIAPATRITIITPRDAEHHGAQVSIRVPAEPFALAERLFTEHQVLCDARTPDVIRYAPVPLYNTYEDVWRAVDALARTLGAPGLTP
ncbi:MAG: kynureninase [Actinomycetota bacterium]|jgi:kynureninase